MNKEELIGKQFNLDLGSLSPVSMVVKKITDEKVIVEYLHSTPKRIEEFSISDFEYFASIKIEDYEFAPRRNLSERYSKNSFTDEELKLAEERIRIKEKLIQKYLDKGYTQEQAKTTALRIMYIPGFSGPTFKD